MARTKGWTFRRMTKTSERLLFVRFFLFDPVTDFLSYLLTTTYWWPASCAVFNKSILAS